MLTRIGIFVAIVFIFLGCSTIQAGNQPGDPGAETARERENVKISEVKELRGYFVKNTVKFDRNYDFRHLVISNQEDFDKYFGPAKTMTNKIDKIDFTKNAVIAIITKPSNIAKKIDLVYSERNGDELLVLYQITEGDKNTYKSTGLYLATIPKTVARVKFKSRYNVGIEEIR